MSTDKNSNLVPIVCKIQYQFVGNIISITRGSSKFHSLVSFINDLDWLDFYHSPASVIYDEKFSRVNAGRLYDQNLTLKFPGNDEDNTETMDELLGPGLIIRLVYSDGKSKILGDLNNPVRIFPDYKSDPDRTGYTININHKSTHPAPWLEIESGGIPDTE